MTLRATPAFAASRLDAAVAALRQSKDAWAATGIDERMRILAEIKTGVMQVARNWALVAGRKKQIPEGSPLAGEEWISGPYALMAGCNALIETLGAIEGKRHLRHIPIRTLGNGQIAAKLVPHSVWDRVLLSGVTAEVWMQKEVTRQNLARHVASAYDVAPADRIGKVALVLGAGNIAAISPLDCLHKLFSEHQVALLKMNPVNDYLAEHLEVALKPLIERNFLRIVRGGADVGEYLCNHPGVDEIHITGAEASHDAIVWGVGEQARTNKRNNTPRNRRRITSELGGVGPTIVVPGPWTKADISFQAEHIATQKLHNSGFNCIACQMLILPDGWTGTDELVANIAHHMKVAPSRPLYYPGAADRVSEFASRGSAAARFERDGAPACVVVPFTRGGNSRFETSEVFAPAMSTIRLRADDAVAYLREAIGYANESLHGTLGANILIHPATIRSIGRAKFEALLAELRYGCIAVNAWTGLGFLLVQTPWGAFPGHTLDDVQSGIGFVHNAYLFDKPERTVVEAPFRPFPRNLLSGGLTLLPRPPWFVTNKKQHKLGELLTRFQYRPGVLKLPRILLNALLG